MSLLSRVFHKAVQIYQKKSHDRFVMGLQNLKQVQMSKLHATLNYLGPNYLGEIVNGGSEISSYADFAERFPVTNYSDSADFFQSEKEGLSKTLPELVRFQPTSGSTHGIKWIPYTSQLLKDFDAALGPWLYDFYQQTPEVMQGPHYWSLSWLPENLRKEGLRLDDTELFPFWKRLLLKKTMAVVEPVDQTATSELSMFATVVYLVEQESLSFISVWSPTYWLNLVDFLDHHRHEVALSLYSGKWARHQAELRHLPCPRNPKRARALRQNSDLQQLWPKLKTLSAWNTSTSATYAKQIETRWPQVKVVGKGLWATEACITIPFQGRYVLAVNSHFFEFQDLSTQEIFPSWNLKPGQEVCPIVTTAGGLIRYKMQDALKVTGFQYGTPCFEFLGRIDGTDLVGEKTSSLRAHEILQSLSPGKQQSFLFAVKGTKNYYCAMMDSASARPAAELAKELDELLSESFHYRLARELGQLSPAQVRVVPEPLRPYTKLHVNRGMVLGNIKIESLRVVSEAELQESLCH